MDRYEAELGPVSKTGLILLVVIMVMETSALVGGEKNEAQPHRKCIQQLTRSQSSDSDIFIRYPTTLWKAPVGLFSFDLESVVYESNQAFREFFGFEIEEFGGLNLLQHSPDSVFGAAIQACLEGKSNSFEGYYGPSKEQSRYLRVSLSPFYSLDKKVLGGVGVVEDLTAQKKAETENKTLEESLRQRHKMEALGMLAGGIAHDFNNILSVIGGFAELARARFSDEDPLHDLLSRVLELNHRATGLVRQILTLSRGRETEAQLLKFSSLVKESLKLFRPAIPSLIEIRLEGIEENKAMVRADPTQLYQLLMNLCINGVHAMEERHGVLGISLQTVRISAEATGQFRLPLKAGEYVELKISDNGRGIPSHLLGRIFEANFTTKPVGKGTGLGLHIVEQILKNHQGSVLVESTEGVGTTFKVYLPTVDLQSNEERTPTRTEPVMANDPGKLVLVVDDESALVDFEAMVLEGVGYKVAKAENAQAAEQFLKKHGKEVKAIVCDHTMPKQSGYDFYLRARNLWPEIPFVLTTGIVELDFLEAAKQAGMIILPKPFGPSQLTQVVSWALAQ